MKHQNEHTHDDCCAQTVAPYVASREAIGADARRFRIPTMDCSAEEAEIRRALETVDGIRSLKFELASRVLTIRADVAIVPNALAAIKDAGFDFEELDSAQSSTQKSGEHDLHDHDVQGGGFKRMIFALVLATGAEAVSFFAPETAIWKIIGMGVAGIAIWLAGLDVYKKGLAALARGKLNINALMSVAVTGAFIIGQWPEAAMVMALYGIAELIEAKAVDRARNAIKSLLDLAPEEATVQTAEGGWVAMPVKDVGVQAVVRIRPGERVPLDGIVTRGSGAVNQAPVTGESIPVDKEEGDQLFAGTINETGEMEFRVTAVSSNTMLARIIEAVEQAQSTRAPTQRFVDRFAAVYTPVVFAIAFAVAIAAPFFLGLTWLEAVYKALVLLVIACPCALVISTPVTVVSGLAAAARRGVLIKGGTYLETARLLKAVAFDKTGTVTEGKPRLVDWGPWKDADRTSVEQLAVSLAGRSDHPVSQAIASGLRAKALEASDFVALPGRGVEAIIGDRKLLLANHRAVHERGLCSPEVEAALQAHEFRGRTVTLLADGQTVLAIFAVADTIRSSSRKAVQELKQLGVVPVMLTGDNKATAAAIAVDAGISDARGDLLPEDKLRVIKEMQQHYGATGMAGDGINDAPALAQADIGFAMGGAGTDTAMESADIVIMNDDLRRVAESIRLSQRTHSILWQNIILALSIKAVFFVLAVFGSATMWMAVFADMGASLLVVANGLRLLRPMRSDAASATETRLPTNSATSERNHG